MTRDSKRSCSCSNECGPKRCVPSKLCKRSFISGFVVAMLIFGLAMLLLPDLPATLVGQPASADTCSDIRDNDSDGLIDGSDPDCGVCEGPRPCAMPVTVCNDVMDNDGDGLVDMQDPDCSVCADERPCMPVTVCNDVMDNDGDGLVDMQDPDCSACGRERPCSGGAVP